MIRIVITSRTDDVHAAIADHPGLWGCGKTQYEAVGNLVMAHRELFGIEGFDVEPRFPRTYCSHCGGEFGPGNHGFSHCENHAGMERKD